MDFEIRTLSIKCSALENFFKCRRKTVWIFQQYKKSLAILGDFIPEYESGIGIITLRKINSRCKFPSISFKLFSVEVMELVSHRHEQLRNTVRWSKCKIDSKSLFSIFVHIY